MKTKKYVMIFAAALLCATCGDDKKEDNPPQPSSVLESLTITEPTVKPENRTITDKASEYSYADKADATVKMTFKNAEPATKDLR